MTIFRMALVTLVWAAAHAETSPDFVAAVRTNFDAWDADCDKAVSANEIANAVADPNANGPAAALRRAVRGAACRPR